MIYNLDKKKQNIGRIRPTDADDPDIGIRDANFIISHLNLREVFRK